MIPRLLILALSLSVSLPAAVDAPRLLAAIALVETGNAPKIGKAGETGVHQMGVAARRDNGTAAKHLAWIRAQLRRHGADDNATNIAICWNAGLTKTVTGKAPVSSYDYARRVVNIYEGGK